MDSASISSLLFNNPSLKKKFSGVIPCDYLPKFPLVPAMFVVNTQDSSQPGLHWIAINCPADGGPIEVFDSFGQVPENPHIKRFLKMYFHSQYSPFQIQNPFANTCGAYACLFLYYRAKGVSFKKFLSMFTNDFALNEEIVKEKFKKYILDNQKPYENLVGYGFLNNNRCLFNSDCNQTSKCLSPKKEK